VREGCATRSRSPESTVIIAGIRTLEHFLIAHRRLDSSPAHQWLKDTLLAALRNPD